MAKPYIYWDPSVNSNLTTTQSEGPLLVSVDPSPTTTQIENYKNLMALSTRPVLYGDEKLLYANETDVDGTGFKISNYEFLPYGLTFSSPGPDPFDLSLGAANYRLINLGFRFGFRGWIGTMDSGGLNGNFRVKWSDEVIRAQSDSRSTWTGLVIGMRSIADERTDFVIDALHGKREADTDWAYHGGFLDRVPGGPELIDENTVTANDIQEGQTRIILSGGSPLWSIQAQYYNGASWQNIDSWNDDIRSHVTPSEIQNVGLLGYAYNVLGKNFTVAPSEWSTTSVWIEEVELTQFEPWVIDTSRYTEREWSEKLESLTGFSTAYDYTMKRPVTDLMHYPMGTTKAPDELRSSDPDLGICINVGNDTSLLAYGVDDVRYIEDTSYQLPITVCDDNYIGSDAPFAAYMRLRVSELQSWSSDKGIISFGNIFNASPSASDNGIGIYWQSTGATSGRFVGRIYSASTGWQTVNYVVSDTTTIDGEILDIGFVWSGSCGAGSNRNNYEFRIIVNADTKSSIVVSDAVIAGTEKATIGAIDSASSMSFLLRAVAVYADCITDYEASRSFDNVTGEIDNPSFELPAETNRRGEALNWKWISYQSETEWADFNSYDPDLEQWFTSTEEFGAGWSNIEDWVSDITVSVFAIFNEGVTAFESTLEEFGFWDGAVWNEAVTYITPDTDTSGPYNGPTGIKGWYDQQLGSVILPQDKEDFGSGWSNDPLSGTVDVWNTNIVENGIIKGSELTFPLTIPPDKNILILYLDFFGIIKMQLTSGRYENIGSLVSMVDTIFKVQVGDYAVDFSNEGNRLTFGWDGTNTIAYSGMFGYSLSNDARSVLGFSDFGGGYSEIPCKTFMFEEYDYSDSDEVFYLDGNSYFSVNIKEWFDVGKYPQKYDFTEAYFNFSTSAHVVEYMDLEGWFGSGAAWKDEYGPGDLTPAMFNSGADNMEEFLDTNWPNEAY